MATLGAVRSESAGAAFDLGDVLMRVLDAVDQLLGIAARRFGQLERVPDLPLDLDVDRVEGLADLIEPV